MELNPDLVVLTEHKVESTEKPRVNILNYEIMTYYSRKDFQGGSVLILKKKMFKCISINLKKTKVAEAKISEACMVGFGVVGEKVLLLGLYRSAITKNSNLFLNK